MWKYSVLFVLGACLLMSSSSWAAEEVQMVPCSAVNDTSCVYKSDLVEGNLYSEGASYEYFVVLSQYTYGDSDGLRVEVQALSSQGTRASITIYAKQNSMPSIDDFDNQFNISCVVEECYNLGSLGICDTDHSDWYFMVVNNVQDSVYYALKFSIVDTTTLPFFECATEDAASHEVPALIFYIFTTFCTLICCLICLSFCVCCCGSKGSQMQEKMPDRNCTSFSVYQRGKY